MTEPVDDHHLAAGAVDRLHVAPLEPTALREIGGRGDAGISTPEQSWDNDHRITARPRGRHEPDGGISYGFEGVDDDWLATLPDFIPAAYTGIVDSHPNGVAITNAGWAVADAAWRRHPSH